MTDQEIAQAKRENGIHPDEPEEKGPHTDLWHADENCDHKVYAVRSGGVKCIKCQGWYCL